MLPYDDILASNGMRISIGFALAHGLSTIISFSQITQHKAKHA